MILTEKIDKMMDDNNINRSTLSKESGIPYTTIDGFYKKGTDNVKLSTLKKLSSYFNCSLDYLVDDDVETKRDVIEIEPTDKELTKKETILLSNFNKLNDLGKRKANDYTKDLTETPKYIEENNVTELITATKEEYNFAAHDDGLSPEKAKERIAKAKAIFKQMDEEE